MRGKFVLLLIAVALVTFLTVSLGAAPGCQNCPITETPGPTKAPPVDASPTFPPPPPTETPEAPTNTPRAPTDTPVVPTETTVPTSTIEATPTTENATPTVQPDPSPSITPGKSKHQPTPTLPVTGFEDQSKPLAVLTILAIVFSTTFFLSHYKRRKV